MITRSIKTRRIGPRGDPCDLKGSKAAWRCRGPDHSAFTNLSRCSPQRHHGQNIACNSHMRPN